MTKDEALKILPDMKGAGAEWDKAIDLAIEALKAQLTEIDTTSDTISRQDVLDEIRRFSGYLDKDMINRICIGLNRLPSAQPYTDEEIQKIQELEQAQLDRAFGLGREDAKPQWIPVTERLPEPRTDVWVNSDIGQIQGYYEENAETWYASFGQGRDYLELIVNAWMPLPEPYAERRADG